jgi:hypothetical protein
MDGRIALAIAGCRHGSRVGRDPVRPCVVVTQGAYERGRRGRETTTLKRMIANQAPTWCARTWSAPRWQASSPRSAPAVPAPTPAARARGNDQDDRRRARSGRPAPCRRPAEAAFDGDDSATVYVARLSRCCARCIAQTTIRRCRYDHWFRHYNRNHAPAFGLCSNAGRIGDNHDLHQRCVHCC